MTLLSVSAAQTPLGTEPAQTLARLQSGAQSLLVRLQSISRTGPSGACRCQGRLPSLITHSSFMGTFSEAGMIPAPVTDRGRNNETPGALQENTTKGLLRVREKRTSKNQNPQTGTHRIRQTDRRCKLLTQRKEFKQKQKENFPLTNICS